LLLQALIAGNPFVTKFFSGLAIVAFAIAFVPALAAAQVGSSQSKQLVLGTRPATDARKPAGQLNTLNDLFAALNACWKPPPLENAHPGMQITMRFSFNRDGRMIGPPQVTYATAEVTPENARCLPRGVHAIAGGLHAIPAYQRPCRCHRRAANVPSHRRPSG
jgi:hypothetical protein